MPADLWAITGFTLLAALAATTVMLPPGIALAWLLARREFRGKAIIDTVASLPLVMPPVATGLILLYLLGRRSPVGRALAAWGIEIVFTWKAVVLAMAVMGFPLLVRTVRTGFEQVRPRYEQLAATLGAGPWRIFFTITLPLAKRAVAAGALLAFTRAVGEFGATILVAGSIPGRTRTLALAIFSETEVGHDERAAALLGVAVVIAFAAVAASNALIHRPPDDART
jgi:molybdate transport system permease protein